MSLSITRSGIKTSRGMNFARGGRCPKEGTPDRAFDAMSRDNINACVGNFSYLRLPDRAIGAEALFCWYFTLDIDRKPRPDA